MQFCGLQEGFIEFREPQISCPRKRGNFYFRGHPLFEAGCPQATMAKNLFQSLAMAQYCLSRAELPWSSRHLASFGCPHQIIQMADFMLATPRSSVSVQKACHGEQTMRGLPDGRFAHQDATIFLSRHLCDPIWLLSLCPNVCKLVSWATVRPSAGSYAALSQVWW